MCAYALITCVRTHSLYALIICVHTHLLSVRNTTEYTYHVRDQDLPRRRPGPRDPYVCMYVCMCVCIRIMYILRRPGPMYVCKCICIRIMYILRHAGPRDRSIKQPVKLLRTRAR